MAKDGHDHRPGLKGRTEANQLTDSSQGPSTSRRACKALDYPAEPGENFAWDKRGQRSKASAWNDAASQEVTVPNHLLDRARL